ncbi:MAG TPA: hypothetical protein VLM11_00295, partial [Streptosporangiaceae bacterium]|nr:hypothetical protein [Streptosporangiaceae bacterium]
MTDPPAQSHGPQRPLSAPGPVAKPRAPAAVRGAAGVMLAAAAFTAVLGGLLTARWDRPSGYVRSGADTVGLALGISVTVTG